jgi:hypothetical protein
MPNLFSAWISIVVIVVVANLGRGLWRNIIRPRIRQWVADRKSEIAMQAAIIVEASFARRLGELIETSTTDNSSEQILRELFDDKLALITALMPELREQALERPRGRVPRRSRAHHAHGQQPSQRATRSRPGTGIPPSSRQPQLTQVHPGPKTTHEWGPSGPSSYRHIAHSALDSYKYLLLTSIPSAR